MTPRQVRKRMDKILKSHYGEQITADCIGVIKDELDECLDKCGVKLDFDVVGDYTHFGMVAVWPNDDATEQYFCKMCGLGKTTDGRIII